MGWMSNLLYAYKVTTSPWRGAMTLPRELILATRQNGEPQLITKPVSELAKLRVNQTCSLQSLRDLPEATLLPAGNHPLMREIDGETLEILTEIEPGTTSQFGIRLKNEVGDQTLVGYDVAAQVLFIDRRISGVVDFDSNFGQHIHTAPLQLVSGTLQLHIFIDASSIEVFGNSGTVVITDLIFPKEKVNEVEFYNLKGNASIHNFDAWELESIWGK